MQQNDKRPKRFAQHIFLIYSGNMNLKTYFDTTDLAERRRFAGELDVSERYLYLCSRGDRKPSIKLCKKIVQIDSRFTLAELRDDIWGNGIEAIAAIDDTQFSGGVSGRKPKRKNGGG